MKFLPAILSLFLCLVLLPLGRSQTPQWAQTLEVTARSNTAYERSMLDPAGNLVLFGSGTEGRFVRKVDPNGVLLWQTEMPVPEGITTNERFGNAIADPNGDLYVLMLQPENEYQTDLVKLRGTDGVVLWQTSLKARFQLRDPAFLMPAGPDKLLVVGRKKSGSQPIVAVELKRPNAAKVLLAQIDQAYLVDAAPLTAESVVARLSDGTLLRIELADLSVTWSKKLPTPEGYSWLDPTTIISDGAGTLYVLGVAYGSQTNGQAIMRVDPATGDPVWQIVRAPYGSNAFSCLTGNGDLVLLFVKGYAEWELDRFNRSDGTVEWSKTSSGTQQNAVAVSYDPSGGILVTVSRPAGEVVIRFDEANGNVSWETPTPLPPSAWIYGSVLSTYALPSGKVVVVGNFAPLITTATLWWFDGSNGAGLRVDSLIERAKASLRPLPPLAIGNDVVMAGSYSFGWAIERIDMAGKIVWRRQIAFPSEPVDARWTYEPLKSLAYGKGADGIESIYATGHLGNDAVLYRLNAATGAVIWTWNLTERFGLPYVSDVVTTHNGDAVLFGAIAADQKVWAIRIRSTDRKVLWWRQIDLHWIHDTYDDEHVVRRTRQGDLIAESTDGVARIGVLTGRTVWLRKGIYGLSVVDNDGNAYGFGSVGLTKLDYATGATLYDVSLDLADYPRWLGWPTLLANGQMGIVLKKSDGTAWIKAYALADGSAAWEAAVPALDAPVSVWPVYMTGTGSTVYLSATVAPDVNTTTSWVTVAVDIASRQQLWVSDAEPYQAFGILAVQNSDIVSFGVVPKDGASVLKAKRYPGR